MSRALVLGGGGVSGIAWETGVLMGLRDEGVDVAHWDRVIGTSAGSIVGARLLDGDGLDAFYESQADALPGANDDWVRTLGGRLGSFAMLAGRRSRLAWVPRLWLTWVGLETLVRRSARRPRPGRWKGHPAGHVTDPNDALSRIGELALAARTAPEDAFVAVVEALLAPRTAWPIEFAVTAVDALNGSTVIFDATSDVPLARAVAASCALPTILPPITIGGRPYVDGGVASDVHLGLVSDHHDVLAIMPVDFGRTVAEAEALRQLGVRFHVVHPGPDGRLAIGREVQLLDPDRRARAARTGREDGRLAGRELMTGSQAAGAPIARATAAL